MIVKALAGFTCWTGEAMIVANVGDEVELPDAHAAQYIEGGMAEKVKGKKGRKAAADPAADPAADASADEGADEGADQGEGDAADADDEAPVA